MNISGKEVWLPEYFNRVHFKQMAYAQSSITLKSKERSVRPEVDLLLHFNGQRDTDETGRYQIVREPVYSSRNTLFGQASGFFQGKGGLVLRPNAESFLGYNITDHDFRISFWFYPFFVENGEVLFEWEGQLTFNGQVISQRISATFQANRIVWQFRNVFLAPGENTSLYEVRSGAYIPEDWYYHQLAYDETNAMLEVFSDNLSDGITYTTADETASSRRRSLIIDNPHLSQFSIGPGYFGLIDEWEISRLTESASVEPMLYYFPSGSAYSRVIDLENHNSQVNQIRIRGQQPADSQLLLYYAISSDLKDFSNPKVLLWNSLHGRSMFFDNLNEANIIGQYIQFKVELFSDSKSQVAPLVQGLDIVYDRKSLPAPPSNIIIDRNNRGGVYIQWQPSVNNQVLGYKIFVGKYSGQYLEPSYPIDVGDNTSFLFSDLQEKVQYFFVIASYDKFEKLGPFSQEYSIRHVPKDS